MRLLYMSLKLYWYKVELILTVLSTLLSSATLLNIQCEFYKDLRNCRFHVYVNKFVWRATFFKLYARGGFRGCFNTNVQRKRLRKSV